MNAPQRPLALTNALTVDVEDYFQVSALAPLIERTSWDQRECRVERNVERLLDMFGRQNARATFFTLGWVAERYPQLVRRIVAAGHELASHGYGHLRASDQSREEFLQDVRRAKGLLEDLGGQRVLGYRAPSFSIGHGNPWAFDVLLESGYRYSSSVYPVQHDHYGMPDAPRFPYQPRPGLTEIPVTTARVFGRNLPAGRLRLLPAGALRPEPLGHPARQPRRPASGDLLLPSLGNRSRAAARAGHQPEDALSPLRQPRQDRTATRAAAARLPLGTRRRGVCTPPSVNLADLHTAGAVAALSVRPFRDSDRDRWDRFVLGCAQGTFFHRIGWREIYEDVFRHRTHYLLAERGERIVGVLPLVQLKSLLFGHSLVSLPFAVYGGVAASEPEAVGALHHAAVELGRELGVAHLELRNVAAAEPGWPRTDLYVTFRKELLPEVEANMLAIPRKQRAMVRKGIQRELRSEIEQGTDRFFELYADNQHRHGTPPQSRRYFQALARVFGDDCEVLTVLSPQGKAVSGVLSFYFRDEVLPYYAGDLTDARDLAANDFKYWELMRRACERKLRVFDYGRSKRGTGSFDFKKNWGFEPAPLNYEYQLFKCDSVPQNNPSNPKYQKAIETWRRLPRGLVNAVGPMLARHLG
jgi:FemAB-related protein (PEP-CTERM system-associated)